MRRTIALALAALALLPVAASGTPVRLTVTAATTVASQQAPRSTVDAAWTFTTEPAYRLHVTGANVPGAVSTVTASWSGTERADTHGRLVRIEHVYVYAAAQATATANLKVDYRIGSRWYSAVAVPLAYTGSTPLLTNEGHELLVVRVPSLAGRTVPVRATVTMRYPDAAYRIDDAFVVRGP